MLRLMMEVVGVREGVLFTFTEKPAQLNAIAWSGLALFPQGGYIPLLGRQVNALVNAPAPEAVAPKAWDKYLSASGNVAAEVLPSSAMQSTTRSAGSPRRSPTARVIRAFA